MYELLLHTPMPLHYLSAGRFVSGGTNWIHPRRTLDSYELIYVLEGTFAMQEGDDRFTLTPGSMLLLLPGVTHAGVESIKENVSFYWVHFTFRDPSCITIPSLYCPAQPASTQMSILFHQLLHYAHSPSHKECSSQLAAYQLGIMLMQYSQLCAAPLKGASRIAADVRSWIHMHADRPLSSTQVSDHFGYTSDYITTLLKQEYGMGLKQCISHEKMELAKNLLSYSPMSVQQIAAQVGYSDYKSFLKAFKYHEGITPTKYKNAYFRTHLNKR